MAYEYVKKMYGIDPQVGQRVRHNEIDKWGTVARSGSQKHYVYVKFDGRDHADPCHPHALDYFKDPDTEEPEQ